VLYSQCTQATARDMAELA